MRKHLYALLLATALAPTIAWAQVPANDVCSGAIPISCGQLVQGNTSQATLDANAILCGTSVSAAGIWYSIAGSDQAITLSTCPDYGFDTKINVYRGSCGALACVAGNDDGGNCEVGSTVTFAAAAGTTYLVLVQGYEGSSGSFDMSVACAPITYDHCLGATPIACNESLSGSTLNATSDVQDFCVTGIQAPGVWFTFTGVSDPVILSTCESSDFDTRINVYAGSCGSLVCITGNDDTPGAGTCSTVSFVPDPDLQYYILVQGYDGETGDFLLEMACQTCGTPSAVTVTASHEQAFVYWQSLNPGAAFVIEYGPFGFTPGTGDTVEGTLNSSAASAVINGLASGTEYMFYLQELCGEGDVSSRVGPFVFNTLQDAAPDNALCSAATPLACGESVEGDTGMSFFLPTTHCGAAHVTAPGLWYAITGNGQAITLSTCDSADFDTKISVFAGSCDALVCVAGADDAPGCPQNRTEVSFPTTNGTTYFVLVHGYGIQTGNFILTASCGTTCSPIPSNDACADARPLNVGTLGMCTPSTGDNSCAFPSGAANPPCEPYQSMVDVWYTFNTGAQTSFTLLLAELTADQVNAAVYAACDGLEYVACETEINGPWHLNNLQPGTDHWIRVWNGGGTEAGTFAICIEADLTTRVNDMAPLPTPTLWPNPAHGQLNIGDLPTGTSALHVIDLQGRVVRTIPVNNAQLVSADVNALAPGAYLVRTSGDTPTTLGRFVKE